MSKSKDGVGGKNDGASRLVCDALVRKGNMDSKKTTSLETIILCLARSKTLYPFFPIRISKKDTLRCSRIKFGATLCMGGNKT